MKQPRTKKQVLRLIESCGSPGAKLAVALAAFSGLRPGADQNACLSESGGAFDDGEAVLASASPRKGRVVQSSLASWAEVLHFLVDGWMSIGG